MTREQWLVYLWGIYPQGGWTFIWLLGLILSLIFLFIAWVGYNEAERHEKWKDYNSYYKNSIWYKLKKWKIIVPSFFAIMLFISNLIPNRDTFVYILATPYAVESGKSIIEDLKDENSKIFKLNKLLDKSLDKALKEIDKEEGKK